MAIDQVAVPIRGFSIVRFGDSTATADCVGGLPRDGEFEVRHQTPFHFDARVEEAEIELTGDAERVS
ncbi:MAG: hypothetical protein ABIS17_00050 [Casimicrobiaceae bacterium]